MSIERNESIWKWVHTIVHLSNRNKQQINTIRKRTLRADDLFWKWVKSFHPSTGNNIFITEWWTKWLLRWRFVKLANWKRAHQSKFCAENRRKFQRRSNIYLYPIWQFGIESATFDISYLCLLKKKKGRWRYLINCCPDKSMRATVEDDADDRSIMPQRRLEKPTIERQSCQHFC